MPDDISIDAHRYWIGLLLLHAARGIPIRPNLIYQHLADLKNGVPIDSLGPGDVLTPATWDEENLKRYPAYEAVGLEIAQRIERFQISGDVNDLTDTN